jgi:predicted  nucleic acid-binding Zn-ribbon protein
VIRHRKQRQSRIFGGKTLNFKNLILSSQPKFSINQRISFHLIKMDQVTAEINFIKVALGSFVKHQDENERRNYLVSKLDKITDETLRDQLSAYLEYEKSELKDLLKELQKEKNLLQEEKNKQLGLSPSVSSQGNSWFDWLID